MESIQNNPTLMKSKALKHRSTNDYPLKKKIKKLNLKKLHKIWVSLFHSFIQYTRVREAIISINNTIYTIFEAKVPLHENMKNTLRLKSCREVFQTLSHNYP